MPGQAPETAVPGHRALVHVEGAVDLDLKRMDADFRRPVMARDEGPWEGGVPLHVVAHLLEPGLGSPDQRRGAGGPVAVAEHEIGPARQEPAGGRAATIS